MRVWDISLKIAAIQGLSYTIVVSLNGLLPLGLTRDLEMILAEFPAFLGKFRQKFHISPKNTLAE